MTLITKRKFLLLFLAVFLLRLGFGLLSARFNRPDYEQTYLIGLKYYTTGAWPYFGPDIQGFEAPFESQIPGALEGLLIGLSFSVLPIPEAPFILVNLLSAAGIAVLSWYIHKRLPALPFDWLVVGISVLPWSLHNGTVVFNPALAFLPAVLFFVGFLESLPRFRLGLLPKPLANAAMGFAIVCIMQVHFSYVFLVLLAAFSLGVQCLQGRRWESVLFFLLGSAPPFLLVVPTYLRYGLMTADVASGFAVLLNVEHLDDGVTILARFLSLVSFELPVFVGGGVSATAAFLMSHPWILLPGVFVCVIGLLQPVFLLWSWFAKDGPKPQWRELRLLVLASFLVVYISFLFTVKIPRSHIYMVFFPLLMVYSCHCYARFAESCRWRLLGKLVVVTGIYFQLGYAIAVAPEQSMYLHRATIAKAIAERDYRIFGERRPGTLY